MRMLRIWEPMDFEQFGKEVARETRDKERAIELGGLKIYEYRAMLQPEIDSLSTGLTERSEQRDALCAQLYDPADPISDKEMFATEFQLKVLLCILAAVMLVSVAAHIFRFILFGLGLLTAIGLGIVGTLAVAGIGHLAFESLLRKSKLLQAVAIGMSAGLMIWGVFQLTQAGSLAIVKVVTSVQAPQSYVDEEANTPNQQADPPRESDQARTKELLSSAVTKILLSADLILGTLLGNIVLKRSDPKYVLWNKVAQLGKELDEMNRRLSELSAMIEVAERQCMAGILRFFYGQRAPLPPYFKAGATCIVLLALAAPVAEAQTTTRQEGILIDVSASVGRGAGNNELFREYLAGARRLLMTEPPSSRVVVSLISTESFGSAPELLKGWTPAAQGVFTDNLDHARYQLASAFEKKAVGVTPIAAGTDIFGGLWRIKTLLESSQPNGKAVAREIWIFSDMMNETPAFNMSALLAGGPERMLEQTRNAGLIVPLKGYRVHVVGATTRGLTPSRWNVVKAFWFAYVETAGGELASYAVDAAPER